jgi:hypothetical protein
MDAIALWEMMAAHAQQLAYDFAAQFLTAAHMGAERPS